MHSEVYVKQVFQGPVYYSLVQKQSQSGITFNKRLFILLEKQYIGYISKPNLENIDSSVDIHKLKALVRLKDINKIHIKDNILTLTIFISDDKGKRNQKKWVLRMKDQQMVSTWQQLLQINNSPTPSRNTTKQHQQLSKIINLQQVQIQSPIKKEHSIHKIQSQQKKAFRQPMETIEQQSKNHHSPQQKSKTYHQYTDQSPPKSNKNQQAIFDKPKIQKLYDIKQQKYEEIKLKLQLPFERSFERANKEKITLSSLLSQNKVNTPPLPQYKKEQSSYIPFNTTQISPDFDPKKFINFFRKLPSEINNKLYKQFIQYAKSELIRILTQKKNIERVMQMQKGQNNKKNKYNSNNDQEQKEFSNPIEIKTEILKIKLIISQLKQVPIKSTNGYNVANICDQSLLKQQLQSIKNIDYIWQCILRRGMDIYDKFLFPVGCLIQYGGWIVYVQCNYDITTLDDKSNIQTQQALQLLSDIANISKQIFEDETAMKFNVTPFNQIIITEVNKFLPRVDEKISYIRPQLFQLQQGKYQYGSTIKQREVYSKKYEQDLYNNINKLLVNLEKLDVFVMHPIELAEIFHQYGINVKCIGIIYKNINKHGVWFKSIIMSDVLARSFKIILRKKIQEKLLQLHKPLAQLMAKPQWFTSFLNSFLTASQQPQNIFKTTSLHAQILFNVPINRNQINKGYLILALEHHLGIKINARYKIDNLLIRDDFVESVQLQFKVKLFKENYMPLQIPKIGIKNLLLIIQEPQMHKDCEEQVLKYLNIKQNNVKGLSVSLKNQDIQSLLPCYLTHSQREKIINYLANFLDPKKYGQLQLYKLDKNCITVQYCRRYLLFTKWQIRDNKLKGSLKPLLTLQHLYKVIDEYYSSSYPFLSQIYDLISLYYSDNRMYYDALYYTKQSLTNLLQICGDNTHIKLANCYYQLAQIYIQTMNGRIVSSSQQILSNIDQLKILKPNIKKTSFNALEEALTCLKKSKNILQINSLSNSVQYAFIEYQLGKLNLFLHKDNQAIKLLSNSIKILKKNHNISELINCYELMSRCYWNNPNKFIVNSQQLQIFIQSLQIDKLSDYELLRSLKIIIQSYLIPLTSNVNHQLCIKLSEYLIKLPTIATVPEFKYSISYIKNLFHEKRFSKQLKMHLYPSNLIKNLAQIFKIKYKDTPETLQFNQFFCSLIGALGQGYISQSLINWSLVSK